MLTLKIRHFEGSAASAWSVIDRRLHSARKAKRLIDENGPAKPRFKRLFAAS
jgi:hypothetical protein